MQLCPFNEAEDLCHEEIIRKDGGDGSCSWSDLLLPRRSG